MVLALLWLSVQCGWWTIEECVGVGVGLVLLFCVGVFEWVVLRAIINRITRRRFQFSLTTLLLFVAVAGPAIGLLGPRVLLMLRTMSWDWGVYKPYGELILLITTLMYLACFLLSCMLLHQIGRTLHRAKTALVVAGGTLIPMGLAAYWSVSCQMTSLHYQQHIHVPAVAVFGICFIIVLTVRLLVGLLTPEEVVKSGRD
jgi:hypothetical protein